MVQRLRRLLTNVELGAILEKPVQKKKGISKALKDKIIGSLERTAKLVEKGREQKIKPIRKKQQMEPDDRDWDEEGRNDVVDVMENGEPEKVL